MRYDMSNGFLPISKQDMIDQGIEQLDFVYVCGDAYVDHPSFGHAIIARLLQAHGYTVGIISQPDWKDDESISILDFFRLNMTPLFRQPARAIWQEDHQNNQQNCW